MRRDDCGFTLIELLIAISVLSIMSGVLLHAFVMSRHFNAKARVDEVVLDAAERTMEAIKGTSLTRLDAELQKNLSGNASCDIELNGITYTCVDAENAGYVLTSETQHLGGTRGNGNYIIEAGISWSSYGDPAAGSSEEETSNLASTISDAVSDDSADAADSVPDKSVLNTKQAPRIADVNIPQNVILDHQTLLSKETAWWLYFDILNEQLIIRDEEGKEDDINCYAPSEAHRFLYLTYSEKTVNGTTTLTVEPQLVYILPGAAGQEIWNGNKNSALKSDVRRKTYSLGSFHRSFSSPDGDTKTELPRIYLFLPVYSGGASTDLDGIYMDVKQNLQHEYELYLIPSNADADVYVNGTLAKSGQKINAAQNADLGLHIYTFGESDRLDIAADAAQKRMFEIYVSVYEEPKNSKKAVLNLHSTKRE